MLSVTVEYLGNLLKWVRSNTKEFLVIVVIVAVLAALPNFVPASLTRALGYVFIFIILTCGFNIVAGYSGQVNLGYSLFPAIGAFVSGLLFMKERWSVYPQTAWLSNMPSLPIPLLIIIGAFMAMVVGLALGLIFSRLSGYFFAMATAVLPLIYINISGVLSVLTGGWEGFTLKGGVLHPTIIGRYYATLAFMIICLVALYFFDKSKLAAFMKAVRDDEDLAMSIGINKLKYKLLAVGISSFLGGLGGALMIHYTGYFMAEQMAEIQFCLLIILSAIMGGLGTYFGPIIGGGITYFLYIYVMVNIPLDIPRYFVMFLILLILMLIFPRGIYPSFKKYIGGR